jgi:hypothetical protein
MVTRAGSYNPLPQSEAPEASIQSHRRASAIALSVLAALVSFLVLPVEGAIFASLGVVTLLSLCTCIPMRTEPPSVVYRPWYQRARDLFPAIPSVFRRPDPVGYRVQGGHFGVPQGTDPRLGAVHARVSPNREPPPRSNGPRVPVGRSDGTRRNI